jgi:lipopolysaccharide export system protein LptC
MADALKGPGGAAAVSLPASHANGGARARVDGARQGMDYTPPERTGAFKASARHTSRVRFMRRFIIVGSVLGVSAIALVAAYNPFRHLPFSVSMAGVGVHGTKVTMDLPKITGVQQGGGPYEIRAKAGVEDITQPTIMDLEGVDANVGMSDLTTTHVTSTSGVYDSKADTMALSGDVKVANSSGYTFSLKTAQADFRNGVFTSHERLRVDLKGGQVFADDMKISNNGHVIAFVGNVSSTFDASDDSSPAPDEGTRQAQADVP